MHIKKIMVGDDGAKRPDKPHRTSFPSHLCCHSANVFHLCSRQFDAEFYLGRQCSGSAERIVQFEKRSMWCSWSAGFTKRLANLNFSVHFCVCVAPAKRIPHERLQPLVKIYLRCCAIKALLILKSRQNAGRHVAKPNLFGAGELSPVLLLVQKTIKP